MQAVRNDASSDPGAPPTRTGQSPSGAPVRRAPSWRGGERFAAASLLLPLVAGPRGSDADAFPALGAITILGSGRLGPTASAALGLIGAVVGGMALRRAKDPTAAGSGIAAVVGRRGPEIALVLGALSTALGVLFLVTADGGPGTGNGVVGSLVAIVAGPTAIVLGGLARTRRHARSG